MHATLLTPGSAPTSLSLYMPPDCLEPDAYDQAGNRTVLPRVCMATDAEDTAVDPNVDDPGAPLGAKPLDKAVDRRHDACAVSALGAATPRVGSALALALAAVLGLRRRRHWPSR